MTSKTQKIIFLSGAADKSKLLEALINNGHKIAAVVLPQSKKYEKNYEALIKVATKAKIQLIITPPAELNKYTKGIDFEILISSGYPFIIPTEVFSRAKIALNFHPTLLPKYRGRYLHPILINNDKETGVSAHLIDENYDTGPIVKQIKYPVETFDTIKSLSRKNIAAEIKLVLEVLDDVYNDKLKTQVQDESNSSSYFKQRTPEDSEINPEKSLKELFYEIRCCDPDLYPAYFMLDGQKVYIKLFRQEKPKNEFDMI